MSEDASFDLDRGFSSPRDIVGKTVVHRPRREIGYPLVVSVVCGLFALGLLGAAVMTGLTLSGAAILVVLELVIGGSLGWLAVMMAIDLVAALRFNRRRYEVRFGLSGAEIGSVDGVERVALANREDPQLAAWAAEWAEDRRGAGQRLVSSSRIGPTTR